MKLNLFLAIAILASATGTAHANSAHFGKSTFISDGAKEHPAPFSTDTPKIFFNIAVKNVESEFTASAACIAQKTDGARKILKKRLFLTT